MTRLRCKSTLLAVGAVALVVAGAVAFVAIGRAGATAPTAPQYNTVSNHGTDISSQATSADEGSMKRMAQGGSLLSGAVTRMAQVGGDTIFRLPASTGPDCYGLGQAANAATGLIGEIRCSRTFPSSQTPLLDFTIIHGDPAHPQGYVWRSEGVAADGVASVTLLGLGGQPIATTAVVNNVYRFVSVPRVPVSAVSALDSTGNVVANLQLGTQPFQP